jgi:primosomal replication protein N
VNHVALSATVIEIKSLRYTPAGIPAIEMQLSHQSSVVEAGHERTVMLEVSAIALGDIALLLADTPLGADLTIKGFLASARKGANRLVLHIQQATRVAGGITPVVV